MATFDGYSLTLETPAEVKAFVGAFEKAAKRDRTEVAATIEACLRIVRAGR